MLEAGRLMSGRYTNWVSHEIAKANATEKSGCRGQLGSGLRGHGILLCLLWGWGGVNSDSVNEQPMVRKLDKSF